ncbi:MAG: tetratricopeptide repeat protein [Anaerolineaceae bacterium]|jgi:cytochrome c-type biogenesis protein CcmH/NrfG|nr:tetratricopeptide repeat protein [Anaerolineaceae bacterium]
MAKISLRAYNHEIENLIDHGQTEEASAHCKYILKIFPKHLDTYRLLGKTYLESQRYSEAADILQRVLAVVPDDFVSQIGLSIIREDEGNLDAAIWNMERAFEVQPSNGAVQEELRRLYGNRDGVQPPRVRLTRGALVRMYTKGNLYQQAIAEARAAIAESPKRTDLEILLARNYYLSKSFAEATEICSRLVKKMPYCYEANLILAEVLPKVNKTEEAKVFAKRVQELDPYAAFTDRSVPTAAQVPDDAVTLEKLEWQPSMEDSEQPRWAKSIGVDVGSQSEQPSTDWLSDMPEDSPESSAPMPFIIPEISSTKPETSLPGWMKEDEWNAGKDTLTPDQDPQSNAFLMDDDEELHEAEIPEWLQSMAPDEIDQGQPSDSPPPFETPASEASDAPDWMDTLDIGKKSSNNAAETAPPTPFMETDPAGDEENIPEWMQSEDVTEKIEDAPVDSDVSAGNLDESPLNSLSWEEETPDWLKDLDSSTREAAEEPGSEEEHPVVTDMLGKHTRQPEVPDWLSDIEQEDESESASFESTSAAALPEDIPDWLQNLESAASESTRDSHVSEIEQPVNTDSSSEPTQPPEMPDWLSDMEQEDEPASASPAPTQPAIPPEDIPDWLQDLDGPASQPIDEAKIPDTHLPGVTDMLGKPVQEPEVPDWLSDMEQEDEPASASPDPTQPATPSEDIPDWLQDLDSPASQPIDAAKIPDSHLPGVTDMLGKPAQEPEVPDWLNPIDSEAVTAPADDLSADISDQQLAAETPQAADEVPDWLKEFDSPDPSAQPENEQLPAQETSLPISAESPDSEAAIPETAMLDDDGNGTIAEMPEDPDEAFAWLESLAAQHGAEEEALSTPIEERDTSVPDWLQESKGAQVPADNEPALTEAVAHDSLPDWLQDLDKETTETQSAAESQPAAAESTPPKTAAGGNFTDWLHELDEEEISPTSEEIPAQPAPRDEVPDWLQDFNDTIPQDTGQADAEPETANRPMMEETSASTSLPEEPAEQQPVESISVPDWLNDLAEEDPSQAEEIPEPTQEPQDILPDWMKQEDKTADELPPAAKSTALPDWLESLKPADTVTPPPAETTSEPAAEIEQSVSMRPAAPDDEMLAALLDSRDEIQRPPSDEMPEDPDEAFAWLESLAAKHGAEEDALITAADERQEAPPDWVQELGTESGVQEKTEQTHADTVSISDLDTGVDLLDAAEETPADTVPERDEAEAQAQQWLQSLASGKSAEDLAASTVDQVVPHMPEQPEEEPAQTTVTTQADEIPSDPAAAFAWLESLAAQHGADEESLSTPPEDRDSTTPDWLHDEQILPEAQPEQRLESIEIEEEDEPLSAQENLLPTEDSTLVERPTEPGLPAWLKEFEEPLAEETPEEPERTPQSSQDETIIQWLQNMDEEESPADEPTSAPPAPGSASKDVITEPVKAVEKPADDQLPVEAQQEIEQPIIQEPAPEFPALPVQETHPAGEAVVQDGEQAAEPEPASIREAESRTDFAAAPAALSEAQKLLNKAQIEDSVALYKILMEDESQLDAVIKDLNDALLRHPVDSILWLTLGDAYMQKKEMQNALSAYTKAEELLR